MNFNYQLGFNLKQIIAGGAIIRDSDKQKVYLADLDDTANYVVKWEAGEGTIIKEFDCMSKAVKLAVKLRREGA